AVILMLSYAGENIIRSIEEGEYATALEIATHLTAQIILSKFLGPYINKAISSGKGTGNYPSTRQALHQDLTSKGYTAGKPSANGYVVYKHPDGSRVNIKPTGEVIPTKKVPIDPNNTAWNAPKYNQRVYYDGTPIPDGAHTTDHFVEPFGQ
ncbi:hypothetical protein RBH29_17535, partial [Herbivorax sp. ANBcel31]|uniref:hypothetical protein n=1 Tax=Herbivorax sp. ANBcel31 TaxID=3069754 RepID=UPI0027B55BE7